MENMIEATNIEDALQQAQDMIKKHTGLDLYPNMSKTQYKRFVYFRDYYKGHGELPTYEKAAKDNNTQASNAYQMRKKLEKSGHIVTKTMFYQIPVLPPQTN